MKMGDPVTIVFPTELAKRRTEYQSVLKQGAVDTSGFLTRTGLLRILERKARLAGILSERSPSSIEQHLLFQQAAETCSFSPGQPLSKLSVPARADLLHQLIDRFGFLAEDRDAVIQWFLAQPPEHKLHGFGQLLESWETLRKEKNIIDRFILSTALLRLVREGDLLPEIKPPLHFQAVHWLNPFEERLVYELKQRLGPDQVPVFSSLPPAHADEREDRLQTPVRSEPDSSSEWTAWTEDFADAYAADDCNILAPDSRENISFFVSAHPYGEIEDAARRIIKRIQQGQAPGDIVLILRNLSPYTDIIPHVFSRFGIPYYFRRGIPAPSLPPVKALLSLLSFHTDPRRDRLCDLLLSPAVHWPDIEDRKALVQHIRQTAPPRITRLPKELTGFVPLKGHITPRQFAEHAEALIEQHQLDIPEEIAQLIRNTGEIQSAPFAAGHLIRIFETRLDNLTVPDENCKENGVWVINPLDAAGLRFKTVFLAGMDDHTFPEIPKADSLLNKSERTALQRFLEERKISCPRLALSETGQALIQEEILFLTAISTAEEHLTLSFCQSDIDGKERNSGEFFQRLHGLAGAEALPHGQSFHTILPPEECQTADEFRQTRAFLSEKKSPPAEFPAEKVRKRIRQWIDGHPEFSATALESLARNRYVFFLEKILGIKPDRTHEDDIDPMDRGTLIHNILEQIYKTAAEQSGLYARKTLHGWEMAETGEIALVIFTPDRKQELLNLAQKVTEAECKKAERRPGFHIGHPAVWKTEKQKIHRIIQNVVQVDIETAQKENRFPALFELKFDEKHDLPVVLQYGKEQIRLKGKIDRIDLIFNKDNHLEQLLVIDYKSPSRNDSEEKLQQKISHNLDCQLALYTFAAQQFFYGAHNTPDLNEKTQAVYHLQERDLKKMMNHFQKKQISIHPELSEAFLDTLFSNMEKLRAGDLATEPLIEGYDDYSHICRTTAIPQKDVLSS